VKAVLLCGKKEQALLGRDGVTLLPPRRPGGASYPERALSAITACCVESPTAKQSDDVHETPARPVRLAGTPTDVHVVPPSEVDTTTAGCDGRYPTARQSETLTQETPVMTQVPDGRG
jgi:hypothetical protein